MLWCRSQRQTSKLTVAPETLSANTLQADVESRGVRKPLKTTLAKCTLRKVLWFQESQETPHGQVAQQDSLMRQRSRSALVAQGVSREAISILGEEAGVSGDTPSFMT